MTTEELIKLLWTILGSVGGTSVIIIGLSSWLGKIWAERIYQNTQLRQQKEIEELKHKYSTELEHLRSEITARRDLLNVILNSLSSGYSLSQARTLQAVEAIWAGILNIREFSSILLFPHTVIYPAEFEKLPFSKIDEMLPQVSIAQYAEKIHNVSKDVENHRPFVGEKLWKLFSINNVFIGRLATKTIICREKGHFYPWDKDVDGKLDTHLFESLQSVFKEDEFKQILNSEPLEIIQRITWSIEKQILDEMNELCIGRKYVSLSIDEKQRIENLLGSLYNKNIDVD